MTLTDDIADIVRAQSGRRLGFSNAYIPDANSLVDALADYFEAASYDNEGIWKIHTGFDRDAFVARATGATTP